VPLLFLLSYGGGIVAGDTISLSIALDPSTRLTVATQGSTKIFKASLQPLLHSPSLSTLIPEYQYLTSHQNLDVNIGANAALWLGPDPTTPFAGSAYAQKQIFHVAHGGSVGIVDWVSEGRRARGESWDFTAWRGRNEIWTTWERESKPGRRLLVRDSVILEGENIRVRMDNMGILATVILHGPVFELLTQFFLEEFKLLPRIGGRNWDPDGQVARELTGQEKWREGRLQREGRDGVVWTAARVRECTVVKFGAREVEGAKVWLEAMLKEDGSVGREFGEGGLMCVR
jgi:urease accessory protein